MTESSLRDRVLARLMLELAHRVPASTTVTRLELAEHLTDAVFNVMSGARPCVTCGKGIGPAKVAKGYVQCYDCTRRRPTRGMMATEHPLST